MCAPASVRGGQLVPRCVRLSISFVAHDARSLVEWVSLHSGPAGSPSTSGRTCNTHRNTSQGDPPGEVPGRSAGALSLSRGDNSLSWCVISQTLENVKGRDSGAGCGWGWGCLPWLSLAGLGGDWKGGGVGERDVGGEEMTMQAPCPQPVSWPGPRSGATTGRGMCFLGNIAPRQPPGHHLEL